MKFDVFKGNFTSLQRSSSMLLVSNTILVLLLAVSLFMNFQKDTVVINNLNESCNETILSANSMNEDTHKRLAYYVSTLIGNITPDNAHYVDKAIMPFVAPEIYQDVKDALATQLGSLIEDEISMTFIPETFIFEDGIAFVTGKGSMIGLAGKREKYTRTYELEFDVQNYTPVLRYIDVYNDVAHDLIWKNQNQKKLEKNK